MEKGTKYIKKPLVAYIMADVNKTAVQEVMLTSKLISMTVTFS